MQLRFCLLIIVLSASPALRSRAQESDAGTRRLWDEAFRRQRAGASVDERVPAGGEIYVGLTLWRLRPSTPPSATASSSNAAEGNGGEWIAERAETGLRLAAGERLRLGVESARRGYLYVLDTEEYADGSRSEPRLVFPTIRTRGGDNRVAAGRLVEIPDPSDTPPYFSIRRSRTDHVADVLTVIVAPHPLKGVVPGREQVLVKREQLALWERAYGAPASRLELPDGAGRPQSPAELAAAASTTRLLAHDDPLPQTLFRIESPAGGGAWVQLSLSMSEKEIP
jgi:hypothetical protein